MSMDYAEHLLAVLREASDALEAACKLLDKRFGSRGWRKEWTIGDTAEKVRHEAFGFADFDEAQAEADRRKSQDGRNWSAWYSAEGYPMVMIAD